MSAIVKLRLLETAAQLPGVRMGADHTVQGKRALEVATVWYNDFVESSDKVAGKPKKDPAKKGGWNPFD